MIGAASGVALVLRMPSMGIRLWRGLPSILLSTTLVRLRLRSSLSSDGCGKGERDSAH
jgi:hypothetical protein